MTASVRNVPGSARNLTPQPGCSYTDLTDDPVQHRSADCTSLAKSPTFEQFQKPSSLDVKIEERPTSPDPEPYRSPTPCINIPTTRISDMKQEIDKTPRLIKSGKKISCACENMSEPRYQIKRGCIRVICEKRFYKRCEKNKIAWRVCIPCCGIVCPDCRKEKKCPH